MQMSVAAGEPIPLHQGGSHRKERRDGCHEAGLLNIFAESCRCCLRPEELTGPGILVSGRYVGLCSRYPKLEQSQLQPD